MKKEKKLLIILALIVLLIIVALFFWYHKLSIKTSDFTIKDETKQIKDSKEKIEEKVVGWLRVEGTNIDLVLIELPREYNEEEKKYNFAWTNSFPDEKSNRPVFISHNIRNVSRNPIVGDDNMNYFEQLMSFIYPTFIKENQFIEYTDSTGNTDLYRIYAVSLTDDDQEDSFKDTYTKEEQEKHIKKAKKESMYDIDTDVTKDDLLLTLYTCTRFYGLESDILSFRVDARKLREGESKEYARIKTNDNYKKIKERMEEDGNEEENEQI